MMHLIEKIKEKLEKRMEEDRPNILYTVWGKILIAEIVVLELLYLGGAVFFSNHFLLNSSINGVDVSLMTAQQAQEAVEARMQNYQLEVRERDGGREVIHGSDIDLQYEITGTSKDSMNRQVIFFWFANSFNEKEYTLDSEVTYNSAKLRTVINNLECMQEENVTEPTEPQIVYEENKFTIVEGTEGNKLSFKTVKNVIEENLSKLMTYVDLEASDCYEKPKFHSDSPEVKSAMAHMEEIRKMEITYELGSHVETLDGNRILEWVTVDDNFEIVVDRDAVEDYINDLKDIYEDLGFLVDFQTTAGDTVALESYVSENSLPMLDSGSLSEAIQTVVDTGDKKLKWSSSDLVSVEGTFIEINLNTQHLYCYENGTVIMQADIISGKPSAGTATPSGIYSIYSKLSPKPVNADVQKEESTYWLAFNGRLGLQDAEWQNSFGGNRYISVGTDGSIHLPADIAEFIYEHYDVGDIVVIYDASDVKEEDENGEDNSNDTPGSETNTPENPTEPGNSATTDNSSGSTTEASAPSSNTASTTTTEAPTTTTTAAPATTTTEAPTTTTTEAPTTTTTEAPTTTTTEAPTEASTELSTEGILIE